MKQTELRITPAWAGKRPVGALPFRADGDHPRMGGEKSTSMPQTWRPTGSPPRGRGKVDVVGVRPAYDRITPAWAGKRSPGWPLPPSSRDHPRMGGENRSDRLDYYFPQGSPPHGRGKDWWSSPVCPGLGITPAWAGKRCSSGRCCMRQRDHPRAGGEKVMMPASMAFITGSPPRGRGKDKAITGFHSGQKITPA